MKIGILYNLIHPVAPDNLEDKIANDEIIGLVNEVRNAFTSEHEVICVPVSEALLSYLHPRSFDIIFNLCEGLNRNPEAESWFAGIYDTLNIPYTGSGPFTLGLCLNKVMAKALLIYHGLQTPLYQVFSSADDPLQPGLKFPLIVKPVKEDGSAGVHIDSVVYTPERLRDQINFILTKFNQSALVEEYIDGRELNVALLGNGKTLRVLPISEIAFNYEKGTPRIVSYESKWVTDSDLYKNTKGVCPADLSKEVEEQLLEMSRKIYNIFGCRDYARIDYRLNGDKIYVLEVNPNPAITPDSGFARSASRVGMCYEEMIRQIMQEAQKRCGVPHGRTRRSKLNLGTDRVAAACIGFDHIDLLTKWFNDPDVSRYMDDPDQVVTSQDLTYKVFTADSKDVDLIFYEKQTNTPMGFGSIYDYSETNKTAEISFLIGDSSHRGKGYAKDIVKLLLQFGFEKMGLMNITANVVENNSPSIKTLESLGFVKSGSYVKYHQLSGSSLDLFLYQVSSAGFVQ